MVLLFVIIGFYFLFKFLRDSYKNRNYFKDRNLPFTQNSTIGLVKLLIKGSNLPQIVTNVYESYPGSK